MSAGPAPTPGVETVVGMPLGVDTPGRPPRIPPVPGRLFEFPKVLRPPRAAGPGARRRNLEASARWCRPSGPCAVARPANIDRTSAHDETSNPREPPHPPDGVVESHSAIRPGRIPDSTLDWSPQVVPRFNRSPRSIPHARNNHCHRKSAVTTGNLEVRCEHTNRHWPANRRNRTTTEWCLGSRQPGCHAAGKQTRRTNRTA